MTQTPTEEIYIHTRIMKYALQVADCRAYWAHNDGSSLIPPFTAFAEFWFGNRSLPRVEVIFSNMGWRFDAFPPSLSALSRMAVMSPTTRALICHWHLQLSDALYREFTGVLLPTHHAESRPITLPQVTDWVKEVGASHWTPATFTQLASKLLSAAFEAGLVGKSRDPRPVTPPHVEPLALSYLFYLLRGVQFEGTLTDNPYLRSVYLTGDALWTKLRVTPALVAHTQGDLVDISWAYPDLAQWAKALFPDPKGPPVLEGHP